MHFRLDGDTAQILGEEKTRQHGMPRFNPTSTTIILIGEMKMRTTENAVKLMLGVAVGGGLMYFADPHRGARRRALVAQKAVHGLHVAETAADTSVHDLGNRVVGAVAEIRGLFHRGAVDDAVLVDRVRARIGRAASYANTIEVTSEDGRVRLSGPVLQSDAERLIDAAASVRGVRDVESSLELYDAADNVPGLHGERRIRNRPPELLRESWSPGTRLLIGLSGALALAFPARSRRAAIPSRILGGLLVARALTNAPLRRMFGMLRRRGIRFQKIVTIHEPVERVFELWSNPENFSNIMSHVHEVKKTGENRFRWTVCGPAGTSATWESCITELETNRLIAWRSLPGSLIRNAGIIRFEPVEEGTRVQLQISYNPPGGKMGHALATLFGVGPKNALDDDSPRLKSLFEEGKTTAHGETVTREALSA
jgi:uncharacterized membrane protein